MPKTSSHLRFEGATKFGVRNGTGDALGHGGQELSFEDLIFFKALERCPVRHPNPGPGTSAGTSENY